jgi:hypothetical protein
MLAQYHVENKDLQQKTAWTPGKPSSYTFEGWFSCSPPVTGVSGFINVSISRRDLPKSPLSVSDDRPERPEREPQYLFKVYPRPERRTAQAEAVINPGGVSVKKQDKVSLSNPEGVGDRGVIKGRSKKSRKRLMELLSRVDLKPLAADRPKARWARALFVTLTYPADFPSWERAKRDLDVFKKRLQRNYPLKWAVWVEEYQKRGAVHFHLVIAFDRHIDVYKFRPWLSQAWYEVVGSNDPRHLKAGTQAVPLHTKAGVGSLMGYISGEMGKVKQTRPVDGETGELIETGRTWGVWYRDSMPLETLAVVIFETLEAWEMFKSAVAMHYSGKSAWLAHVHEYRSWGGALLYGDGRFLFKKLIDGIPGVSLRQPVGV